MSSLFRSVGKKMVVLLALMLLFVVLTLIANKSLLLNSKWLYVLSAPLAVVFLIVQNRFNLRSIYIAITVYGFMYVLYTPVFSPIDEAAHFDYIIKLLYDHRIPVISGLIDTNKLATVSGYAIPGTGTLQYEAVHPPLYYFIGSLFVYPVQSNLAISLISLRMLGLCFLLISAHYAIKSYLFLIEKYKWERNDALFVILALLFYTNPSILTRMITVSNESLVVCLSSILIYLMIKIVQFPDSKRYIRWIAFVSGCLILTKITSVIFILPMVLFIL
ncbi:hypothetical protein, partial [Paenibacillus sp. tmac-D7]|uniref:hypothetical protein n=1 Tax=Paenibacillus sp. tmac-D7 TaxID=2591462 RepID=UPI0015E87175